MKASTFRVAKMSDGQTLCRPSDGYDEGPHTIELNDYQQIGTLASELPRSDQSFPLGAPESDLVRLDTRIFRKMRWRLRGPTWWEDASGDGKFTECSLYPQKRMVFTITADHGVTYCGDLKQVGPAGHYEGTLSRISGGTRFDNGIAKCDLSIDGADVNFANGHWYQPDTGWLPWDTSLEINDQ